MGELVTTTWIDGARYVARLRRRILRCYLCMFAVPLIAAPVFAFWHLMNPFVRGIFVSLLCLAAVACLLVGNVTWFALIEFRCPRCGNYFTGAFGLGYLKKVCKHCGLDLDPAVLDKAKSLEPADLLE
jgi:hypothetical protein